LENEANPFRKQALQNWLEGAKPTAADELARRSSVTNSSPSQTAFWDIGSDKLKLEKRVGVQCISILLPLRGVKSPTEL